MCVFLKGGGGVDCGSYQELISRRNGQASSSHEPLNVPFGYSNSLSFFHLHQFSPPLFEPSDGNIRMMYMMLHDGPSCTLVVRSRQGHFLKCPLYLALSSLGSVAPSHPSELPEVVVVV